MRELIFAKKINGEELTGLIDISVVPPILFCLCDEDKADEIKNIYKYLGRDSASIHKCKYCDAITIMPDEQCYKGPNYI